MMYVTQFLLKIPNFLPYLTKKIKFFIYHKIFCYCLLIFSVYANFTVQYNS